ncbi:MAG: gamma-glutamyltransferase [Ignavibacteriaceae bacterium]
MLMRIFFSLLAALILCVDPVPGNLSGFDGMVRGKNGMVVSANEIASRVGIQILKNGGNAVDAAVAVGFTLAVTYPYAGNLGGGGYMVIRLNTGFTTTLDFRERAPLSAYKKMFQDSAGNVIPELSLFGGSSCGVPGSVHGLITALEKYGTMDLREVIQPAIDLAENGFRLDFSTSESFKKHFSLFSRYPSSIKIFTRDGEAYQEGDLFVQKDLAHTLRLIRDSGKDGFYKGETAEKIIEQVNMLGGSFTLADLENYTTIEKPPVTGKYRDFEIFSMGPSSSGGILLIQMLNVLENFTFNSDMWGGSEYIRRLAETMKYAFLNRSLLLGDENFVHVPAERLLSKEYASKIYLNLINDITPSVELLSDSVLIYESSETTHFSIMDKYGNAVSTTTTINSAYGSGMVVEGAGFLMNNEMDDFSSKPGVPNQFGLIGGDANSIEPGKRMLSSMTPTIVVLEQEPFLVLGSPGGSAIPTAVLQVILNVIDFKMDIFTAVSKPRFHHQLFPDELNFEKFAPPPDVVDNLIRMGYEIGPDKVIGRVQAILFDRKSRTFLGASDPRGNGYVAAF